MATAGSIELAGSNTGLANMMWLMLSRPDWTVALRPSKPAVSSNMR